MPNNRLKFCRVCGYENDEAPWGDDAKSPSFNICPCCGNEAGYGDTTPKAVRMNRGKWISAGAKWFKPENKPADWKLEESLKNLPDEFR